MFSGGTIKRSSETTFLKKNFVVRPHKTHGMFVVRQRKTHGKQSVFVVRFEKAHGKG
jgi:hypothetical protein